MEHSKEGEEEEDDEFPTFGDSQSDFDTVSNRILFEKPMTA